MGRQAWKDIVQDADNKNRLLSTHRHLQECQAYHYLTEKARLRTLLGDVVHQESSYSTSVVSASDRTISLLSSCVPDLRLDGLSINLQMIDRVRMGRQKLHSSYTISGYKNAAANLG